VQLRKGAQIYDGNGASFVLESELGKGGEGSVWSVGGETGIVAKFYHDRLNEERIQKLDAMTRLKSQSLLKIAAWPVSLVKGSRENSISGFLMPRIVGHQEAHLLYSPKSRRSSFPEAQFPFILHVAANTARSFAVVHDSGQVIGDVNHGNLLISRDGTVKLIDCDSFEINDGRTVYPCRVGVPVYTPPELQGRSFESVRRTQQHDSFGLAVLIFHLLFLGRHPFAGIYKHGTADMTIEQAIAEYRFAYLPDSSFTQLEQPPSAPRLADFPYAISQLFLRAFTRDGAARGRPSAHEWIGALQEASTQLRKCGVNGSHHYFESLSACPWCRVEGMVGIPMFGIRIELAGDGTFDLAAVWRQIEAIEAVFEAGPEPVSQAYHAQCRVNIRISTIIRERRKKRIMSVSAIVFSIIVVAFVSPQFVFSILILICGLVGMTKLWAAGNELAKEFRLNEEAASNAYRAVLTEWNKLKAVPQEFVAMKEQLRSAKAAFENLPTLRAQKLAQLNATRREKQLQHFLEQHRIEDANDIAGIGAGRKTLLRSYNIEDAYDVESRKLSGIKGLGPKLQTNLLVWRMRIEQEFRFDPNKGVDPRDLSGLEYEISQQRSDLTHLLTSGPQRLQRCLLQLQAQRSHVFGKLHESVRLLAQSEVDSRALRVF
jgi:DNA-binding helix-hairpin-helix protein with protein kinase domain